MQKIIVMCLCVMLMVSTASANTVWDPAGNGIYPPDAGDWSEPNNWSNGYPGVDDQKPVFNVADAAECQVTTVTTSFSSNLVLGDGGPGGVLRIMDGGSIEGGTGGAWCSIGYNNTARMIVEKGGLATFRSHLWVGHNNADGIGTLDINGGTVRVDEMFGLDFYGNGGLGFVNVNEGLLSLHNFNDTQSIRPGSNLDIRYGKVVFDGDHSGKLTDELADGRITGFGLIGNVNVDLVDGNTTLTATHPMDPWPRNKTVEAGDVKLEWTNSDPNDPAGSVWVDVWFGTDPNKLDQRYSRYVTQDEATFVVVNAPDVEAKYYWQVDSYIYGDPTLVVYDNDDPEAFHVIEGEVWSFNVTNDLPIEDVNAGLDMITWHNEEILLAATVDDDGESELTYAWSADPAGSVDFSATNVEDPTVTIVPLRNMVRGIQSDPNDDSEEHLNELSPDAGAKPRGFIELTSSDLELGSEGNGGRDWQVIAVQYDTLGIPQGATIVSAKITFEVDNSGSARTDNNYTILAEAIDNALPFTDADFDITNRARSTASVSWAPAAMPPVNAKIDTPELKTLIQEVVDRGGWSANNRLTLMIYPDFYLALSNPADGDADHRVQEIEFEAGPGSDSATLTVLYEMSEGSPPASGNTMYTVTLTLAVNDVLNTDPVEDTLTLDVYGTACDATLGADLREIADSDGDCKITLADFAALIAPYWADDYALTVPIPGP